jgi:hypothetical protein
MAIEWAKDWLIYLYNFAQRTLPLSWSLIMVIFHRCHNLPDNARELRFFFLPPFFLDTSASRLERDPLVSLQNWDGWSSSYSTINTFNIFDFDRLPTTNNIRNWIIVGRIFVPIMDMVDCKYRRFSGLDCKLNWFSSWTSSERSRIFIPDLFYCGTLSHPN